MSVSDLLGSLEILLFQVVPKEKQKQSQCVCCTFESLTSKSAGSRSLKEDTVLFPNPFSTLRFVLRTEIDFDARSDTEDSEE